jgi:peroxiredoxin
LKTVSYFCIFVLLAVGSVAHAQEKRSGPAIGASASAFSLPDLQGRRVDFNQFRGRTVVLNFWAFWCDTWREEMPHLRELVKYQDERNFQLVCVSVDGARLQEFKDDTGGKVPFPVLLDFRGATSREYSIEHVPTVVIIDPQGRVRYVRSGYPGNEAVLREVAKAARK